MSINILPACLSVHHLCAWCLRRTEEHINFLELESWVVVSHHLSSGNWTQILLPLSQVYKPEHSFSKNSSKWKFSFGGEENGVRVYRAVDNPGVIPQVPYTMVCLWSPRFQLSQSPWYLKYHIWVLKTICRSSHELLLSSFDCYVTVRNRLLYM